MWYTRLGNWVHALACTFNSITNSHGLAVVKLAHILNANSFIRVVLEMGHFRGYKAARDLLSLSGEERVFDDCVKLEWIVLMRSFAQRKSVMRSTPSESSPDIGEEVCFQFSRSSHSIYEFCYYSSSCLEMRGHGSPTSERHDRRVINSTKSEAYITAEFQIRR